MIRVIVLLAALSVTGCSVFRNIHAEAQRDSYDEEFLYEASGPDAFVERLGEPDSWTNRTEDDRLYMTAVWSCVDGTRREVTWQSRVSDTGRQYWSVVEDKSEDCAEE